MQITVPPDLEVSIERHLASGSYTNTEELFRRAMEVLDDETRWNVQERETLDSKIDRALDQVTAGRVYAPEAARQKLAALRLAHLANRP